MQGSLGLGRLFDRVLGLDVSPAQVEQAKQAVQADNIQFQVRRKRWSRPARQFMQTIFSSRRGGRGGTGQKDSSGRQYPVPGEEEEVEQAKRTVQADNIQFQVRRKRWSRQYRQFMQTIFSSR